MARRGIQRHGLRDEVCLRLGWAHVFPVTRDGKPLRKRRYLFAESFGVIACTEYFKATGDERYLQRAIETYRLMLSYHRTPGALPPKVFPQTRRMKSHAMPMVLVATTQEIRQVHSDPLYQECWTIPWTRSFITSGNRKTGCCWRRWPAR